MANQHSKSCGAGIVPAPSRNSQGSSEVSHMIPANSHCKGLGHQHSAGSGHTAAGDRWDALGLSYISWCLHGMHWCTTEVLGLGERLLVLFQHTAWRNRDTQPAQIHSCKDSCRV